LLLHRDLGTVEDELLVLKLLLLLGLLDEGVDRLLDSVVLALVHGLLAVAAVYLVGSVRGVGVDVEIQLCDRHDELVQRLGVLDDRGAGRVIAVRILLVLAASVLALELLQIVWYALSVHALVVVDVLAVPEVLVHALGVLRVVGERRRGPLRVAVPSLPLLVYYPVLRRRGQLLLCLEVMKIYLLKVAHAHRVLLLVRHVVLLRGLTV